MSTKANFSAQDIWISEKSFNCVLPCDFGHTKYSLNCNSVRLLGKLVTFIVGNNGLTNETLIQNISHARVVFSCQAPFEGHRPSCNALFMAFITECGGRHGVRLVMTLILRTMQAISELSDCILPAKEDLRDSEEHI